MMPFIPTNKECNALFPSLCGNKIHPMMDYGFNCNGCINRPHGKCLDKMLIPGVCDMGCDGENEDLVGAYTTGYADGFFIINESERQRAENLQIHGAIVGEIPPMSETNPYVFNSTPPPWVDEPFGYSITSVAIGTPIKPTSTKWWFHELENCTSFDLANLDSSETTDMSSMFSSCMSAQYLDLSLFDTSKVTNMDDMFAGCVSIETIVVGDGWTVENVSPVNNDMFFGCKYIVGGNGTTYIDPLFVQWTDGCGAKMAHCDAPGNPGYLTCIGD